MIADNPTPPISDRYLDPPVHPAARPKPVVGGRAPLAVGSYHYLVCLGSVLDQKVAHGPRTSASQTHVVAGRTAAVGVALQLDAVVRVFLQQFRQAQQAGETVGENRPVSRKVDLFPVPWFLRELLTEQKRCRKANHIGKEKKLLANHDDLEIKVSVRRIALSTRLPGFDRINAAPHGGLLDQHIQPFSSGRFRDMA